MAYCGSFIDLIFSDIYVNSKFQKSSDYYIGCPCDISNITGGNWHKSPNKIIVLLPNGHVESCLLLANLFNV